MQVDLPARQREQLEQVLRHRLLTVQFEDIQYHEDENKREELAWWVGHEIGAAPSDMPYTEAALRADINSLFRNNPHSHVAKLPRFEDYVQQLWAGFAEGKKHPQPSGPVRLKPTRDFAPRREVRGFIKQQIADWHSSTTPQLTILQGAVGGGKNHATAELIANQPLMTPLILCGTNDQISENVEFFQSRGVKLLPIYAMHGSSKRAGEAEPTPHCPKTIDVDIPAPMQGGTKTETMPATEASRLLGLNHDKAFCKRGQPDQCEKFGTPECRATQHWEFLLPRKNNHTGEDEVRLAPEFRGVVTSHKHTEFQPLAKIQALTHLVIDENMDSCKRTQLTTDTAIPVHPASSSVQTNAAFLTDIEKVLPRTGCSSSAPTGSNRLIV